ncbi:MAG: flagellar basal-body rod protein FlgF [Syntrophomonadaceae bacterium]|nr:flagellar basal-body rod protein FlgF [Syntrophomonadaceae bacterium]
MIRGLYTGCSGMMAQLARQDVLANNLANVSTPGFKKDVTAGQAFPQMRIRRIGDISDQGRAQPLRPPLVGTLGTGAAIAEIATDHSGGNLQKTENSLDLALRADGYFVVDTPGGERYTRNGAFKLNDEGLLTTDQGYPVLGSAGPILLAGEGELTVDSQGNLMLGTELVDTLRIVRFADSRRLVKIGDNLFESGGQEDEDVLNPRVMQGFLETSNVNAVREMVELITVVRAYEANQKIVQAEDQMLDAAVNRVGSL